MNGYGKHNLYWGIYPNSKTWVGLDEARQRRWRVERAKETDEGLMLYESGDRLVLILEDGNFWPVISFLTPEEAAGLAEQLTALVGYAVTSTQSEGRNRT